MINKSEEERIDLDHIADGLSEVRPYKSKKQKKQSIETEQDKPAWAVPEYKEKKDFKKNKVDVDIDIENDDDHNEEQPKKKKKEGKVKAISVIALILSIIIFLGTTGYVTILYGNIPFVVKWRNIWIETAMTTDQHKWLATAFFPERLIDEVMGAQMDNKEISITDTEIQKPVIDNRITDIYGNKSDNILGQSYLVEGEADPLGNIVYSNNVEQGIVIIDVKKSNYHGKLILIDDPSRIYLATTDRKGSMGKLILDYVEDEDAVIGINASGFKDPGGHGLGGVVTGQCVAQGEYWGTYSSQYSLVGFDDQNRLVVGGMSNWKEYNIRDGMQYRPTLLINGKKAVEASSGWGLQPRTVVGQRADGVVMLFVVDGRKVGYSLGATMGECADLLLEYGAVTAGACDGGSSSVIGYKGKIINDPSTSMATGRYLPNAWLVKKKDPNQKTEVTTEQTTVDFGVSVQ